MKKIFERIISALSRKRYYLAVLYADGTVLNAFLSVRGEPDLRGIESDVKERIRSIGNVVLVSCTRVSRHQYEMSLEHDNSEKD